MRFPVDPVDPAYDNSKRQMALIRRTKAQSANGGRAGRKSHLTIEFLEDKKRIGEESAHSPDQYWFVQRALMALIRISSPELGLGCDRASLQHAENSLQEDSPRKGGITDRCWRI
jgi:hypothetical protein